jgi:hypothetical protein
VYAWVRQITDQIFIPCMQGSDRLTIGYSIVRMIRLGGSEYSVVGMIGLDGIEYSIVGIIGLSRLE